MNNLPPRIIRLDDGMEFRLNPKTGKYYVHMGIPKLDDSNHLRMEYSFETLMILNKDKFKIADGIEDLVAMRKKWIDTFRNGNDGHGNEYD